MPVFAFTFKLFNQASLYLKENSGISLNLQAVYLLIGIIENFVTIWRQVFCLSRCETISFGLVFSSQFYAKYFTSLTNQNAKFYLI